MMLSDNLLLIFSVTEGKVEWTIHEETAFSAPMQSDSPKKLIFHEAVDEPPFVWERDRYLQERVDRKVRGISVADVWTIFYTSGMKELMFSVVNVANSNDSILYFSPP